MLQASRQTSALLENLAWALPRKPGWAPSVGFQVNTGFQEPWCLFAQVVPPTTFLTIHFLLKYSQLKRKEKNVFCSCFSNDISLYNYLNMELAGEKMARNPLESRFIEEEFSVFPGP